MRNPPTLWANAAFFGKAAFFPAYLGSLVAAVIAARIMRSRAKRAAVEGGTWHTTPSATA
jgi:hypothetical protein